MRRAIIAAAAALGLAALLAAGATAASARTGVY